jgi:2'-5' RNA ligase
MNLFNLALIPLDPNMSKMCIELARKKIPVANGYLLGPAAHPHVTVSQLAAEPDDLPTLWQSVQELGELHLQTITLDGLCVRPGSGIHAGNYWVQLAVYPTSSLTMLQEQVCRGLEKLKIRGLTPQDAYCPHLTLGRVLNENQISVDGLDLSPEIMRQHSFSLTLGSSDANGVYLEKLYPKDWMC